MNKFKTMNTPTVLVVDDDEKNRMLLTMVMERNGYDVIQAEDGIDALAKIEAKFPHIILLDLMMPKMDGYELGRRLKTDKKTRDIPLIFLTGRTGVEDKVMLYEIGADHIINKPYSLMEAAAIVKSVLRRTYLLSPKVFEGNPSPAKAFISYSWDNTAHKDWVRELGKRIQENGVQVLLDQWDLHPGKDILNYMETSIRDSNYVLLICTPSFATKANSSTGGVGYEKIIVTGEVFDESCSPKKFVPILKEGSPETSIPSYMKSKMFIDFREEGLFENSFEELLLHLYDTPRFPRPPLGNKPNFK